MNEENNTWNNLIWAITIIIIVAIIAGAIFYSGALKRDKKKDINVTIETSSPANSR